MVPPPRLLWLPPPQGLYLENFNIRNSWGLVLVQAIRVVQIRGFDLMILKDTMMADHDYFRNMLGYRLVCSLDITTSAGGAHGGVGLVVRYRTQV